MTLRAWMTLNGLHQRYVAEHLRIRPSHFSGILRWLDSGDGDRQGISNDLKARIVCFTDGAVTLEELTWPHGRPDYPVYKPVSIPPESSSRP